MVGSLVRSDRLRIVGFGSDDPGCVLVPYASRFNCGRRIRIGRPISNYTSSLISFAIKPLGFHRINPPSPLVVEVFKKGPEFYNNAPVVSHNYALSSEA
jgi:hypothetical protein